MSDGELRSGADPRAEPHQSQRGDGLMTSFVEWRQAFESAVMAGNDSMRRTGNVRSVNRNRRSLEHVLAGAAIGALTGWIVPALHKQEKTEGAAETRIAIPLFSLQLGGQSRNR